MEHLEEVLQNLNLTPKSNASFVDIFRIRDIYKETPNLTSSLRQNIMVSHFKSMELEYIVKKYFTNYKGIYCFNEKYSSVIDNIKMNNNSVPNKSTSIKTKNSKDDAIKFEFKLLKTVSDDTDIFEYRFNYFTKNLWQNLYDTFDRHTIIFVASYMDYIRLKSFFE